jgi:hypothetical protein
LEHALLLHLQQVTRIAKKLAYTSTKKISIGLELPVLQISITALLEALQDLAVASIRVKKMVASVAQVWMCKWTTN